MSKVKIERKEKSGYIGFVICDCGTEIYKTKHIPPQENLVFSTCKQCEKKVVCKRCDVCKKCVKHLICETQKVDCIVEDPNDIARTYRYSGTTLDKILWK